MAEVEVLTAKQEAEFERMLLEHPEMKKKVRKVLSSVLSKARTNLSKDAKVNLGSDPRQAYRAVKRSVYRRILGGSLSILAKRRAGKTRVRILHQSTIAAGQMGGNRRSRSSNTDRMDSYFGSDRGFVLRFINAGAKKDGSDRHIAFSSHKEVVNPGSHGGHSKYENHNTGRRGHITPRNWFGDTSHKRMQEAAQQFCDLMDAEIKSVLDK